jgi:hypothetical protein
LALVFYFLPVIADKRNAKPSGTIFLINFVFGRVADLIWAIDSAPVRASQPPGSDASERSQND